MLKLISLLLIALCLKGSFASKCTPRILRSTGEFQILDCDLTLTKTLLIQKMRYRVLNDASGAKANRIQHSCYEKGHPDEEVGFPWFQRLNQTNHYLGQIIQTEYRWDDVARYLEEKKSYQWESHLYYQNVVIYNWRLDYVIDLEWPPKDIMEGVELE